MKFFAILLFFALSLSSTAQKKDTIFYNKYWKKTTKDKAFFYRPLPLKKEKNLFLVQDYYSDGKIQMRGYSSNEKKDIFEGKVTWYFKSGQASLTRTYKANVMHGEEKSYFRDGTLLSEGIHKSNKMFNGTFFISHTQPIKTYTVENGEVIASSAYYEENKKVAKKIFFQGITYVLKTIFYSKTGEKIAEIDKYSSNNKTKGNPYRVILRLNTNKNIEEILFLNYQFYENDSLTEVLKDANGKIVGKGTFKGGRSYNGVFYNRLRLETLKNGLLNGQTIFYDENHKEIARGIYKEGREFSGEFVHAYSRKIEVFTKGKLTAVKEKNKHTGEMLFCTYKNDNPYNGKIMYIDAERVFKDGKLQKEVKFDYLTSKIISVKFYSRKEKSNTDIIVREEFYKKGKTHTLRYKNNAPYDGVKYTKYGYTTYKDGSYNGPFLLETPNYKEFGNYKNGTKEGLFITEQFGKTYKAIFKDNKPFDGAYLDGFKLIKYKNGKKDGCGYKTFNNRNIPHDSLIICYKNDLPTGKSIYYKKGKIINIGIYKNGKPYEGKFYDSYNTTVYKNGEKIKETIRKPFSYYEKTTYFNANNISKEILKIFKKDTVTHIISFKNGLPYNGKRLTTDKNQTIFTLTDYKNGVKDGQETSYKYEFYSPFISQYNYINGKKQGKAQFRLKREELLYTANYKNDKPINGITIEKNKDFIEKNKYKEGEILKTEYYPSSNYDNSKLTEISYKNNQPYNGIKLIFNEKGKDRIAQIYKNGKLTQSILRLYNFRQVNNSKYQTRIYHSSNKDSLVTGGYQSSKPSFKINYTNKNKTSGDVVFFRNNTVLGKASFKQKKLKKLSLQWENLKRIENVNIQLIEGKIQSEFSAYNMLIKYQTDLAPIKNIPLYFYNLIKDIKPSSDITLTLLPENISSTITVKNAKPYTGFVFMPGLNKVNYETKFYKEGKIISKKRGVTKQELITALKKLQK